jgi:stress-induced morphogen
MGHTDGDNIWCEPYAKNHTLHFELSLRGRAADVSRYSPCPHLSLQECCADVSQSQVQDISGGCGSMYAIQIESPKFKGLTVIKQHKLVNQVLKEEIAKWHGVQLRTKAT